MNQADASLKPCILVAPLDWGLGHATRCIPIIHALTEKNYQVIIAAEGPTKELLLEEFPTLSFLSLRGYNVRYSRSKWLLPLTMMIQIPRILFIIYREHQWLKTCVKSHSIDAVISDNRFGLYHTLTPCFFITHQLQIQTPFAFLTRYLQKLNYYFINHYTECWIPDEPVYPGMAGILSHPEKLPSIPYYYLGPLTRFHPVTERYPETHLLIILSGPEPQRSLLEDLLLQQLKAYAGPVIMVRGLPGKEQEVAVSEHIRVFDHLPAAQLEEKIKQASYVVCRCGYSTVMDLMALKKKSICIPTPGQTEQEYLAALLMANHHALCIAQHQFHLQEALQKAHSFNYQFSSTTHQNDLENTIQHLSAYLHKN